MKSKRNILLLLLVCLPSISCLQVENEGSKNTLANEYEGLAEYLEKRIHKVVKKHHLPSIGIVLVKDDKIIYRSAKGLANIEKNIEINESTFFKVYSVAKVFTALEIFREVEAGLINLDDPMTNSLPDFSIKSRFNETQPVTIRNILAHRSGLPRNECVSYSQPNNPLRTLEKFEQSCHDCFLSFPPETRYKYSNLGYDLLGRVIEETRDEGFARYMDINVLPLLGMAESTFRVENIAGSSIIATGYEYYKGKYYPIDQTKNISSVPSGNLYSNLHDLQAFLFKILSNNGVFQKKETLNMMFRDHYSREVDPETMGLGWKTCNIKNTEFMAWHDGGPDDGTGTLIAILPERKIGLVMVSNCTAFGGNVSAPLAVDIFNKMIEKDEATTPSTKKNVKRIKMDQGELKQLAGNYAAFGQIMTVTSKKHKLKGKIGGIGLDLIPLENSRFKVTHWTHEIGLTKIIPPPVDLDKLSVEFISRDANIESDIMIINLDNISYEICPKYPPKDHWPEYWPHIAGEYKIYQRLSGDRPGDLWNGKYTINSDNELVVMSNPFGPVIPITDKYIRISTGPFAGEIMEYSSISGNIIHQNAIFTPYNKETP